MPRTRRRPKPVRGKQPCQSATDRLPAPREPRSGSPGTHVRDLVKATARRRTRRYSIEVKDAETGDTVVLTDAEWTAEQKGLGMALISQLSGLPEGARLTEPDEDPPVAGRTRVKRHYN